MSDGEEYVELMSRFSRDRLEIRNVLIDSAQEALSLARVTSSIRTGSGRVPKVIISIETLVLINHYDAVLTMRRQRVQVDVEAEKIMRNSGHLLIGLLTDLLAVKIHESGMRLEPRKELVDNIEDMAMEVTLRDMVLRLKARPGPFLEKMRMELDDLMVKSVNES